MTHAKMPTIAASRRRWAIPIHFRATVGKPREGSRRAAWETPAFGAVHLYNASRVGRATFRAPTEPVRACDISSWRVPSWSMTVTSSKVSRRAARSNTASIPESRVNCAGWATDLGRRDRVEHMVPLEQFLERGARTPSDRCRLRALPTLCACVASGPVGGCGAQP